MELNHGTITLEGISYFTRCGADEAVVDARTKSVRKVFEALERDPEMIVSIPALWTIRRTEPDDPKAISFLDFDVFRDDTVTLLKEGKEDVEMKLSRKFGFVRRGERADMERVAFRRRFEQEVSRMEKKRHRETMFISSVYILFTRYVGKANCIEYL